MNQNEGESASSLLECVFSALKSALSPEEMQAMELAVGGINCSRADINSHLRNKITQSKDYSNDALLALSDTSVMNEWWYNFNTYVVPELAKGS